MFGGFAPDAAGKAVATSAVYEYTLGWRGLAAPNAPPPRGNAGFAYDVASHQTILFGGEPVDGEDLAFGDTWAWNGASWAQLAVAGPSPRAEHAMATDPVREVVVVVGGITHGFDAGMTPRDDGWEWNGKTWTQMPALPAGVARYRGAMAWDPVRGALVLAGSLGLDGESPRLDTWEYAAGQWRQIVGATLPAPRAAFAMVATGEGGVFAVGGVDDQHVPYDTTLVYNGATWVDLGTTSSLPTARSGLAGILLPRSFPTIVFGGTSMRAGRSPRRASSLPRTGISPTVSSITHRRGSLPRPRTTRASARRGCTAARIRPGAPLGDMWTTSDGTWARIVDNGNTPPARTNAAVAFDKLHQFVVFGGKTAAGASGETFLFHGTWSHPTLPTAPDPRFGTAMVYDANRQVVVMFGGAGDTAAFGDTWEWDGTAWTQRTLAGPTPPARFLPRDGLRCGRQGRRDDRRGRQRFGAPRRYLDLRRDHVDERRTGPAATARARLDDVRSGAAGGEVLFGGTTGVSFDDTMGVARVDCGRGPTRSSPPHRSRRAGAVFGPISEGAGVLIYSGLAGSFDEAPPTEDEWVLRAESPTPPEVCEVMVDNDGDGKVGCADPDCVVACGLCGDGMCEPGENCTDRARSTASAPRRAA